MTTTTQKDKNNQEIKTSKSIEELFKDYNGNYETSEIDWGEPKGNEIW